MTAPGRRCWSVSDLRVAYGHVQAVRGVSLAVPAGAIVTLIGPNGAGKSSTLAAIRRPRAAAGRPRRRRAAT